MRYLAKRGTGRDRYIKLLTVLGAVVHLFAAEKKNHFGVMPWTVETLGRERLQDARKST